MEPNTGLVAALYCRLSKEDAEKMNKGDESGSIQNQRLLLEAYAKEHGMSVFQIYIDDDYSGLFKERPAFERLLEDARQQKFNVVIVKSQSRFTRNMAHMEKYLHTDFPLWGIRFIGVVDHADTADQGNKKARQINGLVNEWYCEDLSQNIRKTFQIKWEQGQFLGAHAPYGYVKDPKDKNHLVIDPYAAGIVKRIYSLYISGMGKERIAKTLDEAGVLLPTLYKTQVLKCNYKNAHCLENTRHWSQQTIHGILKNEVYTGAVVQHKCQKVSYKCKEKQAVPQTDWVRVPNMHEAIIDKDTWETVQALLNTRARAVHATKQMDLFSGKLFCADCGYPMVRKYNGSRQFTGYHCSTYKKRGNAGCASHAINASELTALVLDSIKAEILRGLTPKEQEALWAIPDCQDAHMTFMRQQEALEKRLQTIVRYQKQAFENYADGLLLREEFLRLKDEYSKEEIQLQTALHKVLGEAQQAKRQKRDDAHVHALLHPTHLTRAMVVELIEKIEVVSDGTVHIAYQFAAP